MIVLTAPTGTIGSALAHLLDAKGVPLRLIVRDASRLSEELRGSVDVVTGSHADPAVLDTALAGAEALFVLVPPRFSAPDVTEHYLDFARPIADAVRANDIRRVVAVSSLGRGYEGAAGLLSAAWAMDDVLESSGTSYRSLQPPFFMENLLHQTTSIREQGRLVLTADPDAPFPMVATRDIARTAADLLDDSTWTGQDSVVVREPVDHTPREIAHILSEVLDRPVSYQQSTLADYRAQYTAAGASPAIADAMVEMAHAQARGAYPPVTTGGTGTAFLDWCESVFSTATH
jgi:uncharacterized protein YbjT (DUF2867 family)